MKLRVLLADDEAMARKRLRRLLEALPDVVIVAEHDTGRAALATLEDTDVDVAFLDVNMPGLSGLEVSFAAADLGVEVVFVTAHTEHAVRAFEQGVVDYVVKPVDPERLARAVERARARLLPPAPPAAASVDPVARLAVTVKDEVRLLDPVDVACAILDGELVRLRVGAETVWTDQTLQELERRLEGAGFLRVHRRALVNLAHVDRLRPLDTGGYVAITRGGAEVPVSRQHARHLRQRLGIPRS